MRELIVVFNGNEMSLGIMLATWLFWTAAGSHLSASLALRGSNTRLTVAALQCLLALSLPPTIWALRASKQFFKLCRASWSGLFRCCLPLWLA